MSSNFVMLPAAALSDPRIAPQVLRTLAFISLHSSSKDKTSYCSYQTLAAEIGISRRLVISYINTLCECNYLTRRERTRENGSNTSNRFKVEFDTELTISSGEAEHHQPVKPGITTPGEAGLHPQEELDHASVSNQNKKYIKKSSQKISLAAWEKNIGAELCPQMMKKWLQENRISEMVAKDLVTDFRERVGASGTLFADFTLAFQNWLRRGFLMLTLDAARARSAKQQAVHTYDRGVHL